MNRDLWIQDKREEIRLLYDRVFAVDYDRRFPTASQTHQTFLKHVLNELDGDAWILDAGCGTGKYWQDIFDVGLGVVGIDQSEQMLWRAREKFPPIRTIHAGIQEYEELNAYEAIICIDVLDLVSPEGWRRGFANFIEAIKPGGTFYFTVENADPGEIAHSYEESQKLQLPVVMGEIAHTGYYHYHPQGEQVIAYLQEAGFTPTHHGVGGGYTHYLATK
jgi:SAM-dependent methyltransferase